MYAQQKTSSFSSRLPAFGLAASVFVCTIVTLLVVTFYFLPVAITSPGTAKETANQNYLESFLPQNVTFVGCHSIADGRLLEANTSCVIDPSEKIQTYAAVHIWNYKEKSWVLPPGFTEAGQKLIIDPAQLSPTLSTPVLLTCPWGCTLGIAD